jgi:immune inhibitor A
MMMVKKVFAAFLLAVLILASIVPLAGAKQFAAGSKDGSNGNQRQDDRVDPMTQEQRELRQIALQAKLAGKAQGKVHQVAKGQYVELEREGEGALWTVLGEFSDIKHNTLPKPDRSVDNTTLWVEDFSRDHFMNMLFDETPGANSMRNFYIEQSSNRYTVHGDVTDWIEVSGPAASYDDDFNHPSGGNQVWYFLDETIDGWYAQQVAAGKTSAEINDYLSQFDVWDRYDYDGDGNFDEPDGYIDTFQSVHAGVGNESCSPACDDWAIWSHSWYAFQSRTGVTGPAFNKRGGVQVGNSDYWVGKYTIQPENGGVGVFTHEYGHDLGLPDLYDTAGGENSTAFWTLMSSGSWMGDGVEDIGSKSSHMGAWEKFQLGWLNYEVAVAGQKSEHRLGPMEFNTKQAQAVFVVLPPKPVVRTIGTPFAGSQFYYSGSGDNLNNFMYKAFNLPAGATLSAKVRYNIENNWDYAYLVYSTDNGATWTPIQTNRSTTTNPNGQNFGYGITGISNTWGDLTASLPAGNVLLGFRYWTDTNTGGYGLMVDEINITGQPTDGAEADAGWTFAGFRTSTGQETTLYNHYYIAEFRTYLGYDSTLEVGPYNFGFLDNPLLGDWVEHFPYQDGMLVNYWDTSQTNNNVRSHPGQGLVLPVDAHPTAMIRADGGVWRNRIQSYDSTFGKDRTTALTLHWNSQPSNHPSLPAVSIFDDRNDYYDETNPWGSVIVPNTGTQIRIQSISAQGTFMQIEVRPAR